MSKPTLFCVTDPKNGNGTILTTSDLLEANDLADSIDGEIFDGDTGEFIFLREWDGTEEALIRYNEPFVQMVLEAKLELA